MAGILIRNSWYSVESLYHAAEILAAQFSKFPACNFQTFQSGSQTLSNLSRHILKPWLFKGGRVVGDKLIMGGRVVGDKYQILNIF